MRSISALLTAMTLALFAVYLQKATVGTDQGVTFSASEPGPAREVLMRASRTTAGGRKRIFVVFGASWCGACSTFTRGLAKEPLAQVLEKHFVIVRLSVHENVGSMYQENEGSLALLKEWSKGVDTGVPYYAVLDEHLNLIMDSIVTKYGVSRNVIGFTGEHGDRLVEVIRRTAKGLRAADVEKLVQFVNNG